MERDLGKVISTEGQVALIKMQHNDNDLIELWLSNKSSTYQTMYSKLYW